jgi:hypothetical protein
MNKPKINAFQAFYFVLMSNAANCRKQQTKTIKNKSRVALNYAANLFLAVSTLRRFSFGRFSCDVELFLNSIHDVLTVV